MANDILEHHGVKGMKWGVRKAPGITHPASEDSARANAHKIKARTQGLHTLSNRDIQEYLTRVNLETQFNRTTQPQKSAGRKFVTNVMTEYGKQELRKFLVSNTAETMSAVFKMARGVKLG